MTKNKSHKSKIIAGFLSFLLGGIGIRKFYLGNVGWGIIYLIFSWKGIPMILGIFEGLIYFTMSNKDFQTKYS